VVAISRYMSLGSIMACFVYPTLVGILMRGHAHYAAYLGFGIFAGALALFCHRSNVVRLLKGQENRLDFKKISSLHSKMKLK